MERISCFPTSSCSGPASGAASTATGRGEKETAAGAWTDLVFGYFVALWIHSYSQTMFCSRQQSPLSESLCSKNTRPTPAMSLQARTLLVLGTCVPLAGGCARGGRGHSSDPEAYTPAMWAQGPLKQYLKGTATSMCGVLDVFWLSHFHTWSIG